MHSGFAVQVENQVVPLDQVYDAPVQLAACQLAVREPHRNQLVANDRFDDVPHAGRRNESGDGIRALDGIRVLHFLRSSERPGAPAGRFATHGATGGWVICLKLSVEDGKRGMAAQGIYC
jgi:hypothetical protein